MSQLIYQKMISVMADISHVGKDRKNAQQGYSFRGIDDMYNTLHAVMSKHGVICVPEVLTREREERQTQKGGTLLYTVLRVKYTFYAEDGSSVVAVTDGEAMDSGDKSCNKAMSAAQKYAFIQSFCIPTNEDNDTENNTFDVKPKFTITDAMRKDLMAKIISLGEEPISYLKSKISKHSSQWTSSDYDYLLDCIKNYKKVSPDK